MDLTNMEGVEGDEMKDYESDPDYRAAMDQLNWALEDGYYFHQTKAIDDLITIRLALMMEAQADKIQEAIEQLQKEGL